MMTPEDESRVIEELRADPPRWVIYERFSPEAVLNIWPRTDPSRISTAAMDGYLAAHYREVDIVTREKSRQVVMERVPGS